MLCEDVVQSDKEHLVLEHIHLPRPQSKLAIAQSLTYATNLPTYETKEPATTYRRARAVRFESLKTDL